MLYIRTKIYSTCQNPTILSIEGTVSQVEYVVKLKFYFTHAQMISNIVGCFV
jgi:hypothetical protein